MIHGFGKFWNIFTFFWRKFLDALFLGTICHYSVKCFTGRDVYEISGVVLLAALVAGFVISIVHAVRIAKPANKDKELLSLDRQPDAINVKRTRRADTNVKTHRGVWRVVRHALVIILSAAAFSISFSLSGCDFEEQQGSWIPAVVLVAVCVFYNLFVCRGSRRCKCPLCKRRKAIKLISMELLETTIGDWTEYVDQMDFDKTIYDTYRVGLFGKDYIGQEEEITPVIRTYGIDYHDIELGRYLKQYVCRYCGQRFLYEAKNFEPVQNGKNAKK